MMESRMGVYTHGMLVVGFDKYANRIASEAAAVPPKAPGIAGKDI
jgi:hypothetical protein